MKSNKYLLAMTCAFAATVHAENSWYVLGSMGQSKFDESKSDADRSVSDTNISVASSSLDNTDSAYKLQAGYQFTPNFAIEGGYVDLGELNYTASLNDILFAYKAKVKVDAKGWNIDAVGILPLNKYLSLFAKAGVIDANVKNKTVVSYNYIGETSDTESSTDIKPLFGIGASYSFNDNIAARIEVERYRNLGDKNTTGEGDVDLYSAGIAYKF